MSSKVIFFHQGAELYGSDKILAIIASEVSKKNTVKVILDSCGPLIDVLNHMGVSDVEVCNLAVLRKSKLHSFSSFFKFAFEFLFAVNKVRCLIKKFKPDYIYVNTLAVISPLISSLFIRAKVIHHIHEIQFKPKFIFIPLYTISALLSDIVICVSSAVKSCYLNNSLANADVVKVVYNGIPIVSCMESDIEGLKAELKAVYDDSDATLIAYVARIHSWKGQLEFLDVMNILVHKYNLNVNVAFFGDVFPGYEYIKRQIDNKVKELKLDNHIHFFGFRSDASSLFSLSALSVMGSIEPDPLPTVVLESLQQGTPVIAYGHGGCLEMISDNIDGFLVKPCDAEEMAKKIKSYCDLPQSAKLKFKKAALDKFNNNFSSESFLKNLSCATGIVMH